MSSLRALLFGRPPPPSEEQPPEERAFKLCDCRAVVLERWMDTCTTCSRLQTGGPLEPPPRLPPVESSPVASPGTLTSAFPFMSESAPGQDAGGLTRREVPAHPPVTEGPIARGLVRPPRPDPGNVTRMMAPPEDQRRAIRILIELPPGEDAGQAPPLEVRVDGRVRLLVRGGRLEPQGGDVTRLMTARDPWVIDASGVPTAGTGGAR